MTTLRLPIKDREDICVFTFPAHLDADEEVEKKIRSLVRNAEIAGVEIPVLRVVPLSERGAYSEAIAIALERFAATAGAAWVDDFDRARIAFHVKQSTEAGFRKEARATIRIVQKMLN